MQNTVRRALRDPFFPATYLMHNVMMLEREPWWKRKPFHVRRAAVRRIIRERSVFFLEVKDWVEEEAPGTTGLISDCSAAGGDPSFDCSYCDHCGGCCEIASGLPDFPEGSPIPLEWQRIFGNGLGQGHRFCPFLWEVHGRGQSFCPIHPFRSNACRIFEREECEHFRKDPDYINMSSRTQFRNPRTWLAHLVNRG